MNASERRDAIEKAVLSRRDAFLKGAASVRRHYSLVDNITTRIDDNDNASKAYPMPKRMQPRVLRFNNWGAHEVAFRYSVSTGFESQDVRYGAVPLDDEWVRRHQLPAVFIEQLMDLKRMPSEEVDL